MTTLEILKKLEEDHKNVAGHIVKMTMEITELKVAIAQTLTALDVNPRSPSEEVACRILEKALDK